MLSSDRLPGEVRPVLASLLISMRAVLGDQLVALYLYGSLSSGDFDSASSDVDFLAVTSGNITEDDAAFEQLRAMHARIAASGLPFADHLEGSYISQDTLRRYEPATAWHPTIGVDWPFKLGFHDVNWVIERAIVRERGVILWGPPPATLINPVSPRQLREASCQQMKGGWRDTIHDEAFLRKRNYSAFAILTFCRILYTIHHGAFCSKPVAAAWAAQTNPDWQPMIAWALAHRADHTETDLAELTEIKAFLWDALGLRRCDQLFGQETPA
jgi:Aminoglycoside adenylyltransferase, C-terminal domain